jgi:hypothetical protein
MNAPLSPAAHQVADAAVDVEVITIPRGVLSGGEDGGGGGQGNTLTEWVATAR